MTARNRWFLAYFLFVVVLALYLLHTLAPFVNISPVTHSTASVTLRDGTQPIEVVQVHGSREPNMLFTGGRAYGWMSERVGAGYRIWWAHPLLWLGMLLLLFRKGRAAAVCGALALWLALDIQPFKLALNNPWRDLAVGYYVWLLDMLLLIGAGLLLLHTQPRESVPTSATT
jgi:hypothetical protein